MEGVRMSKVMVALDGSELAETALPHATQLATGLSLKPLLVRVVDTGGPYTGFLDDARFLDMLPEFREDATTHI